MRHKTVFKARHEFAREVFYNYLYEDWTPEQLRKAPYEGMNSLAWVMWHVARVEDVGVTRFVMPQQQVFHAGGWQEKLNIDIEHFGYGMDYADARKLSEGINLDALKGYWNAVIEKTYEVVDALTDEQMDETLSEEDVKQVVIDESTTPENIGMEHVPYVGWTRLESLHHFSMTHYYWHGGEVRTIESLLRAEQASTE